MLLSSHDARPGDGIKATSISITIISSSVCICVRVLPARDADATCSHTGDVCQRDAVKPLGSTSHESRRGEQTEHLHGGQSDEVSEFKCSRRRRLCFCAPFRSARCEEGEVDAMGVA